MAAEADLILILIIILVVIIALYLMYIYVIEPIVADVQSTESAWNKAFGWL